MKRILLSIAMLLAIPAFAICQMNDKNAGKKGGDEQAVRQTINELAVALTNNDTDALDRIYGADYAVTNENGEMTTKAERLAAIKSGDLKFESVSFTDVKVRLYGEAAVTTYHINTKVQAKGLPVGGNLRGTVTLVKMKGRWQVVAAQSTRIAGQ